MLILNTLNFNMPRAYTGNDFKASGRINCRGEAFGAHCTHKGNVKQQSCFVHLSDRNIKSQRYR